MKSSTSFLIFSTFIIETANYIIISFFSLSGQETPSSSNGPSCGAVKGFLSLKVTKEAKPDCTMTKCVKTCLYFDAHFHNSS